MGVVCYDEECEVFDDEMKTMIRWLDIPSLEWRGYVDLSMVLLAPIWGAWMCAQQIWCSLTVSFAWIALL